MTTQMKLSVSGPQSAELATALATLRGFSGPPTELQIDHKTKKPGDDWLARWLPKTKRELWAEWGPDQLLWFREGVVIAAGPVLAAEPLELVHFAAELPIELAAFATPFHDEWVAAGYRATTFSDGHVPHGWACMFKGAGHDRVVSSRWLDYGPWRVSKLNDDVTLIQFYDLDADATTALAQARPGHEHMGISKTGGFLQRAYAYYHELDGVYFPEDRSYRIPVASRPLEPTEMLDACALRADKRDDPKTPLECVGFVFPIAEEAGAYVHELWLRELACWAVRDGRDVRLDTDHHPSPSPPDWVQRLG